MAYDSKWWSMRSGDLIGSNTITQDISDSILKFFGKKDGKAGDIFMVILALFAFHFGIEGYNSIIGKFMVDMPTAVNILVNLIPMGVGCYLFYLAFFNKFDSKVYMEAAAALCIILMGMSLQNLGSDLSFLDGTKWMVWLMVFSIPVIYLATSTVGATIYLYTLFSWLGGIGIISMMQEVIGEFVMSAMFGGRGAHLSDLMEIFVYLGNKPGEAIFGWFFILLILPHFMRYTDRPSYDTRKLFLGWVGGLMLLHISMNSFTGYGILAMPFLIACFYYAGKEYFADGKFWWNRPFQTIAIFMFVHLAWALNYEAGNATLLAMSGIYEGAESANGWFAFILNTIVVLGVIAWGAYSIYNDYIGEKKGNILLMCFPVVMLLILVIDRFTANDGFTIGTWIASLYILALGADYIMKGLKNKSYHLIALGIVIGLPILIYRIHDVLSEALSDENGPLLKGVILIGLSGGLLYIGNMYYKQTTSSNE